LGRENGRNGREMPSSVATPRAREHALVTLAIGRVPFAERTLALMRRWAEREGWAFEVITERRLRCNPNWPRRRFGLHLEKYQLFEHLERYRRVLYVDADVLVHPEAPDPFARVPPEAVGGVWDDIGADAWKREEALGRLAARHGALPARTGPRFLNAGVLVLGAVHRELWRFERKAFARGRWPDQSLFNYRLLRSGTPVLALSPEFNLMPLHEDQWRDPARRRRAYLAHYASQPAKALLEADLPHFERAWEES
jgi:lipopolysaccharide biosynthesis glycosyltransferase